MLNRILKNTRRTLAVAALVVVALAATSSQASAYDYAEGYFPQVSKSFKKAVKAWSGKLSHCVATGVGIYAYSGAREFSDDVTSVYAFVPQLGACTIYFNVDKADNYDYKWFCSVMVHEMGHVAYRDHSRDRRDIMNGPGEIYWRKCLTRRQAKRFRRRGEIIDFSIRQWNGSRGKLLSSASSDHGPEVEPSEAREALRSGDLRVQRIGRFPVR